MVEPKQPDDPNPNHTRPTQQRRSLKGVAKQLPPRHRVTFTLPGSIWAAMGKPAQRGRLSAAVHSPAPAPSPMTQGQAA